MVAQRAGTSECGASTAARVRTTLYFGSARPKGSVSELEWQLFLRDEVTARFPEGLTVWDAEGQWRDRQGPIEHERTKVLLLVHPDTAAAHQSVLSLIDRYRKVFDQQSVCGRPRECASLPSAPCEFGSAYFVEGAKCDGCSATVPSLMARASARWATALVEGLEPGLDIVSALAGTELDHPVHRKAVHDERIRLDDRFDLGATLADRENDAAEILGIFRPERGSGPTHSAASGTRRVQPCAHQSGQAAPCKSVRR